MIESVHTYVNHRCCDGVSSWSSHLLFPPVQSQLGEPLEGVDVIAARPAQLVDDVPGVDLHGDERHHLQTQDFGQSLTNHLQVTLEKGELREGGALRRSSTKFKGVL